MDISWWQLLIASIGALAIIGGFFMNYIRAINKRDSEKVVTAAIAAFRTNELTPILAELNQKVDQIGDVSNRLSMVEGAVKNLTQKTNELNKAVSENAQQARNDLTGLATSLREDTKNQTSLLVKLIEARQ
jgi:uncharacterized protein YoxC